jgi:hypothetical protein
VKHTLQTRLYRVELTDKHGKRIRHLASVTADLDENCRRIIVGRTMLEGGHVHSIVETEDRTRYPGEKRMRSYDQG